MKHYNEKSYDHDYCDYNNNKDYCPGKPMPELSLSQAYVKDQSYTGMVTLCEGFKRGSIFSNLYKPYKK